MKIIEKMRKESEKDTGLPYSRHERVIKCFADVVVLGGIILVVSFLMRSSLPGYEGLRDYKCVICGAGFIFCLVLSAFIHILAETLQYLRVIRDNTNEIKKALQTQNAKETT
ncbi:MAG: hypothetical protein IKN96_08990 [Oscillibacter sp.]|nr:hypothetical protein [Oscillibacter sp.]